MGKKPSNNWYANVLAARKQFEEGLLNPKKRFKITKKDIERLEARLFEQVKRIGKRRF